MTSITCDSEHCVRCNTIRTIKTLSEKGGQPPLLLWPHETYKLLIKDSS